MVMLVEDDKDLRDFYAVEIGKKFPVRAFGDGEAALAAILERPPKVLVLDLVLPKLNGPDLLMELQARGIKLRIIAMTGRDFDSLLDDHVNVFLQKPVFVRTLLPIIERLM